jgi:hypothetical protein
MSKVYSWAWRTLVWLAPTPLPEPEQLQQQQSQFQHAYYCATDRHSEYESRFREPGVLGFEADEKLGRA